MQSPLIAQPTLSSKNCLIPQRHRSSDVILGYWLTHDIRIEFPQTSPRHLTTAFTQLSLATFPEIWPKDAATVTPFPGTVATISSIHAAQDTKGNTVSGENIYIRTLSILLQIGATHIKVPAPTPDSAHVLNTLHSRNILTHPQFPARNTHKVFTINSRHPDLAPISFRAILPPQ
jgi:hypothetical protein